nr:unnamed protein product [Haemonchus contortus]
MQNLSTAPTSPPPLELLQNLCGIVKCSHPLLPPETPSKSSTGLSIAANFSSSPLLLPENPFRNTSPPLELLGNPLRVFQTLLFSPSLLLYTSLETLASYFKSSVVIQSQDKSTDWNNCNVSSQVVSKAPTSPLPLKLLHILCGIIERSHPLCLP